MIASLFIFDPRDEFNAHIDAPAEESVAEKQARLEAVPVTVAEPKNEQEMMERA